MKKIIVVLAIAMSLLLVLSACSTTGQETSTPATTTTESAVQTSEETAQTESPSAEKTVNLGISIYNRDQFFSSQEEYMKEAAKNYPGMEITSFDAANDVQKQLEQISSFATQQFDVIATSLVDPTTVAEIIQAAGDIPIIFQNRLPDVSAFTEGKHTYIGSDETESGKLQGEYLADYFKDSGKDTLNIVILMGELGLDNTTKRTDSAKKALEDAGYTLNVVFEDTANWDRNEAMTKMEQILGTGAEIDAVIANNDEMALGAIEALKSVDKLEGIPVVGIDATTDGLAAVQSGEMAMTVFQNAKAQGEKAVEVANMAAGGGSLDMYYWIPFESVTADNVADYLDN